MSDTKQRTGIEALDRDIDALLALRGTEELRKLQAVLNNDNSSINDISTYVPENALNLAFFLSDSEKFQEISKEVPDEGKQLLQNARKFIVDELSALRVHPAVVDQLFRQVQSKSEEENNRSVIRLNTIAGFTPSRLWFQRDDDVFEPILRVGFKDVNNESLLDSTMDWDDLSFVVNALLTYMKKDFERGLPFSKTNDVVIQGKKKIGRRLAAMKVNIEALTAMAAEYKIPAAESTDD